MIKPRCPPGISAAPSSSGGMDRNSFSGRHQTASFGPEPVHVAGSPEGAHLDHLSLVVEAKGIDDLDPFFTGGIEESRKRKGRVIGDRTHRALKPQPGPSRHRSGIKLPDRGASLDNLRTHRVFHGSILGEECDSRFRVGFIECGDVIVNGTNHLLLSRHSISFKLALRPRWLLLSRNTTNSAATPQAALRRGPAKPAPLAGVRADREFRFAGRGGSRQGDFRKAAVSGALIKVDSRTAALDCAVANRKNRPHDAGL